MRRSLEHRITTASGRLSRTVTRTPVARSALLGVVGWGLAAFCLVAVGCATTGGRGGSDAGGVEPEASPSRAAHDPHLAARLGPGDVLEVRVLEEPDLSGTHRVGPEGSIDFPFCGRLEIQGRTAGETSTLIRDCLRDGRFLRDPQVTVLPKEFHSKKVFVFGHVASPGTFVFESGMSIVQAITLAGGFVDFAARNAVNVTRLAPDGRELRFQIPVADVGTGKAPNFPLEPGDIVYVPRGIL